MNVLQTGSSEIFIVFGVHVSFNMVMTKAEKGKDLRRMSWSKAKGYPYIRRSKGPGVVRLIEHRIELHLRRHFSAFHSPLIHLSYWILFPSFGNGREILVHTSEEGDMTRARFSGCTSMTHSPSTSLFHHCSEEPHVPLIQLICS